MINFTCERIPIIGLEVIFFLFCPLKLVKCELPLWGSRFPNIVKRSMAIDKATRILNTHNHNHNLMFREILCKCYQNEEYVYCHRLIGNMQYTYSTIITNVYLLNDPFFSWLVNRNCLSVQGHISPASAWLDIGVFSKYSYSFDSINKHLRSITCLLTSDRKPKRWVTVHCEKAKSFYCYRLAWYSN